MPKQEPWSAVVVLVCDDDDLRSWPVGGQTGPDLTVVDHVARCALEARRQGCSLQVRKAPAVLCELLTLAGLVRRVWCGGEGGGGLVVEVGGSVVEVDRQPEGGEQPGVEERVQPGDPVP